MTTTIICRNPIYCPGGAAREYSPLALNHYGGVLVNGHPFGCSHKCWYCYCKDMAKAFGKQYPDKVTPRPGLLDALNRQLERGPITQQVFMCFEGDAYCPEDVELGFTREILEVLLKHQVPVSILTKGGTRALRDLDLFKRFKRFQIGATLTRSTSERSLRDEPKAAVPEDRIQALKVCHEAGIKTWVSMEPVLNPAETLELMEMSAPYVDFYKVGRLNHVKGCDSIDWTDFLLASISTLTRLKKRYYIKSGLAVSAPKGFMFKKEERDADSFAV